MKKAVIATGGKQYLVSEGDEIEVELLKESKTIDFEPLLVMDDAKVQVGTPLVNGAKVSTEVKETIKADKVTSIRFKAKKRVNKKRGHRQQLSKILIKKITF